MIKIIKHEIDDMNLSFGANMALKRNGIFSPNQLKQYSRESLTDLKGIGPKIANDIFNKLEGGKRV